MMERIATSVTLAAALCFLFSSIFLFGLLLGLGHLEIAYYFTFSDIVNYTFGTIWPLAGVLGLLLAFDKRLWEIQIAEVQSGQSSPPQPRWKSLLKRVAFGVICGLAAVYGFRHLNSFGMTILAIIVIGIITLALDRPIATKFGPAAGKRMQVLASILSAGICAGIGMGTPLQVNPESTYRVVFEGGEVSTHITFPLERGMVIVRGDTATMVPWGSVRSVEQRKTDSLQKK